ncbi:Plant lipid transfer protein/Par allergen [Macleaya cordata]|uniref:Non-specific lipid-transfer protein n=1 Tax=Macleaya cordata TaxID=56857 RepID=A0A200PSA0_MACCD|nr:Plant lipid transfer protein/Par allergen [Macleaya cordata]
MKMGSKVWSLIMSLLIMVLMALIMINNIQMVNGVSCEEAVSDLIPCATYLMGSGGPNPGSQCCASAQKLNKLASTTADRQSLCECLKQTGPSFGVKPERAKQLPVLCKLELNIPISPDVDCSK